MQFARSLFLAPLLATQLPLRSADVSEFRVPITFEENQGQAPAGLRYFARTKDGAIFAAHDRLILRSSGSEVTMRFSGANPATAIRGVNPLPGFSNYIIGPDPKRWKTGVRTYAGVRYTDVWPGIDLVLYANGQDLEYDFVVAGGADPRAISLEFEGAGLSLAPDGSLIAKNGAAELRSRPPRVYQDREEVRCRYILDGGRAGFLLASYDRTKPVTIDPVLSFSTLFGGSRGATATGIALDRAGNVYVTGSTPSPDFPVTPGAQQPALNAGTCASAIGTGPCGDAFILKLNPAGDTVLFSTFLGGQGDEQPFGIAVDADGAAYVAGMTSSRAFPATATDPKLACNGPADFVAKLTPGAGSLAYSVCLGGQPPVSPNVFIGKSFGGIAVDSSGNAYIAGSAGPGFPTTPGAPRTVADAQDAFVAKLNPAGTALVYSTLAGGNGGDYATGIAVNAQGEAYVAGRTNSPDFPYTAGAHRAASPGSFVFRLNTSGTSFVYSALPGESSSHSSGIESIALDMAGNVYVSGTSAGDGLIQPGLHACGAGAYVASLGPTGSLRYETCFGDADASAIAVDAAGNSFVTGVAGNHLPLTTDAFMGVPRGSGKAFLSKLDASGKNLLYSTYLAGSTFDAGAAIALDNRGNAYIAGITRSPDFPVTKTIGSGRTAFVAKFDFSTSPEVLASSVVSAASYEARPAAPGELVSIFGSGLGDNTLTATAGADGRIATRLGDTEVLFDGIPAPLLYVSPHQINAVAPFEIAGRELTDVTVKVNGRISFPFRMQVASAAPNIFSRDASGTGQGAILNQDMTPNSPSNPARKGSIIMLWATGAGQTVPAGNTGEIAVEPFPRIELPVAIGIGTTQTGVVPGEVTYAGAAPGLVAGTVQINVRIPADAPSGSAIPITLRIGGESSTGSGRLNPITVAIE